MSHSLPCNCGYSSRLPCKFISTCLHLPGHQTVPSRLTIDQESRALHARCSVHSISTRTERVAAQISTTPKTSLSKSIPENTCRARGSNRAHSVRKFSSSPLECANLMISSDYVEHNTITSRPNVAEVVAPPLLIAHLALP